MQQILLTLDLSQNGILTLSLWVYILCCLRFRIVVVVELCYMASLFMVALSFFFFLLSFFSSPNLSCRRLDVCHTSFHTWCGLSANLRYRSETCCMRLAENTGRQKVSKNRHLGTITQLYRAISSQLRHVSTIGKKTC